MSAFTDIDALVNRLSGGNSGSPEHIWFQKYAQNNGTSRTQGSTAGTVMSMWIKDGIPGFPTAGPGAVAIPDNTTAGGLLQTDPGGGRQKWLLGLDAFSADIGNTGPTCYLLYDRLLHVSGLNGTTLTAQTVQSAGVPALTRYTNGVGNFVIFEVYTAIGTTARTITMSYTDDAGNAAQTSQPIPIGGSAAAGTSAVGMAGMFPLLPGDAGVRGVASVTLSASTGTAGDFGITIGHPLAMILVAMPGQASGHKDMVVGFPSLIEVQTDACLALLQVPVGAGSTQTGQPLMGAAHFCEA